MKTFAIFLLLKETFTIRTCSILESFFRKLHSKATFERKLASVSPALRSGPPSDWCLLTVDYANWDYQQHGQKVQDTATPRQAELCTSIAQFYTECAQTLEPQVNCFVNYQHDKSLTGERVYTSGQHKRQELIR